MRLEEAVAFYHSLLRFGMKPGLERMKILMELLGNPQDKLSFVHIAGTNGKGSTAVMLSSILVKAGRQTGLYTSPYITDFRERIQINNTLIDAQTLIDATKLVKSAVEKMAEKGEIITEFEAVTAAAFLCFAEKNCRPVVLETGLGGRFDATNIIRSPLVSIITSISLDHTAILGKNIEEIAFEKSGIIKAGGKVIIPSSLPEAAKAVILKKTQQMKADLLEIPVEKIKISDASLSGFTAEFDDLVLKIPFPAKVQAENAGLAAAAARLIGEGTISEKCIREGIAAAKNPARSELLCENPPILLDGSHNPASTAALADLLARFLPNKKILGLMGWMADKDIDTCLENLLPHFAEVLTVTPSNPRAISANALAEKINAMGKKALPMPSLSEAVGQFFSELPKFDAAVICGSLYLAGDLRNQVLEILHP